MQYWLTQGIFIASYFILIAINLVVILRLKSILKQMRITISSEYKSIFLQFLFFFLAFTLKLLILILCLIS